MKLFESTSRLENSGQETLAQEIKESKYEPANLEEVAESQAQMNTKEKGKFYNMLKKVKKIFLGKKDMHQPTSSIFAVATYVKYVCGEPLPEVIYAENSCVDFRSK